MRLEDSFWSFWLSVIELAQDDALSHDRTVHVLTALKAKGMDRCEGWLVWGGEMN